MATNAYSLAALLQMLQGNRSTYAPVAPSPALPSLQTLYPNAVFRAGPMTPGPPVLSIVNPPQPQQPKPQGSGSSTPRPFTPPPQPPIPQGRPIPTAPTIPPASQPPLTLPQPGGPPAPASGGTPDVNSTITYGGEVPGSTPSGSSDSTATSTDSTVNFNGQVDPATGAVWTVDPSSGVGAWVDPNSGDVLPSNPDTGMPGDSVVAQPIDTTSPGFDTGSGYVPNPNYQTPDTSGGYIDTSGGSYIDYGGGFGGGGVTASDPSLPNSQMNSDMAYNYFG